MTKLAFVDNVCSLDYGAHVALALGPEWAVCYCNSQTLERHPEKIEKLTAAGVEVLVDRPYNSIKHEYVFADMSNNNRLSRIKKISIPPMRTVCYSHGTDYSPRPRPGRFILYSSDRQFLDEMGVASFMLDAQGYPDWGRRGGGRRRRAGRAAASGRMERLAA